MAAAKGNKYAVGSKGGRGPTAYKPTYVKQAAMACRAAFTDKEVADLFSVSEVTINKWKLAHEDFCLALKTGKYAADERVERSLYHRAIGYTYDAVKIFPPKGDDPNPLIVPYREHVPPDTTACIFWLKNRRRAEWRDRQEHEVSGPGGEPIRFVIEGAPAAPVIKTIEAVAIARPSEPE